MKENTNSQGEPPCLLLLDRATPSHRILVVEDDGDVRRLNTEVLIHSGYDVDAAADGAAAWDALIADSYDLMITDNSMPKLTGVELLKRLRSARMELPVIMATGILPTQEFIRSPWLQPAATLLKPYTVEALLETVSAVLRSTVDAPGRFEPSPDRRRPAIG
jgi:DNA-binding response OmpR family regulator